MAAGTDDADRRPPVHRRWWFYPVMVLAVGVGLFAAMRMSFYALAEGELRRVRDAGYPATLAELDAWYVRPKGCNAADDYLEAAAAWVEDKGLEERLPGFASWRGVAWPAATQPLSAEMVADTETYLALNAACLDALGRASGCPESRYPTDLHRGFDAELSHHDGLHRFRCLLQTRVFLLAERSRDDEAAEDVLRMFHLGASLREEPLMLSAILGVALDLNAGLAVERVLAWGPVGGPRLAELQAAATAASNPRARVRAMAGERVIGLDLMRAAAAGTPRLKAGGLGWIAPLYVPSGMYDLDRGAYLRFMSEAVRVADDPALARTVDLDAALWSLPSRARAHFQVGFSFNEGMRSLLLRDGFMRAVAAGVAAERFRVANARLPASLAELVPDYLDAIPEDPMDGLPIRYWVHDDRAVVYSVGRDGVDQGGLESTPAAERFRDGTDATFTLYERRQ